MESSSDCLSPESTVTSLLSSSGLLRSSVQPLEHAFGYKDKAYDSASAALDAYIADFERSCQKCQALTGPLVLPRSRPATPRKPRAGALRNRDVLRERLTDRELDFLHLPVSSLRHRSNRDRVSMTTDELLSIPNDGSMPVTHTSALLRGFPSRSGQAPGAGAGLGSGHVAPQLSSLEPRNQNRPPARTPRCRGEPAMDRCDPAVDVPPSAPRAADLHLPRWLTSNKAHVGCSEVSSLPDLDYPAWIRRCDVGRPELWDERGAPRVKAPSWVSDLEQDEDRSPSPAQTLRDVRLQLAERVAALAAGGRGSDRLAALSRDGRMEALIQKADRLLDALSSGAAESSAGKASPVGTEDLLLSSPPRPPSITPDSGAAELEEDRTQRDEEVNIPMEVPGGGFHGNGTWKQPGPVEAMKQMLFRLQAVEAELRRRRTDGDGGPRTPEKEEAGCEAELLSFPGSPSLQRALLHLGRLKLLVEEPAQRATRKDDDDEEKEEDEGRYSSSSQQEP